MSMYRVCLNCRRGMNTPSGFCPPPAGSRMTHSLYQCQECHANGRPDLGPKPDPSKAVEIRGDRVHVEPFELGIGTPPPPGPIRMRAPREDEGLDLTASVPRFGRFSIWWRGVRAAILLRTWFPLRLSRAGRAVARALRKDCLASVTVRFKDGIYAFTCRKGRWHRGACEDPLPGWSCSPPPTGPGFVRYDVVGRRKFDITPSLRRASQ